MPRYRRVPLPLPDVEVEPFVTAEEAWFWFIRAQQARDDGAHIERGRAEVPRPCEPDDIYRAVKSLAEKKTIGRRHIEVLHVYGTLLRAPDKRCVEETRPFVFWDEALDRLTTVLRIKEIIE